MALNEFFKHLCRILVKSCKWFIQKIDFWIMKDTPDDVESLSKTRREYLGWFVKPAFHSETISEVLDSLVCDRPSKTVERAIEAKVLSSCELAIEQWLVTHDTNLFFYFEGLLLCVETVDPGIPPMRLKERRDYSHESGLACAVSSE